MITTENITKSFGDLQVLKGINVHIGGCEVVSVVGPSGAGKTTLLQIIGTLSRPNSGIVIINNTPVSELKGDRLAAFRNRHIGFVFQFHHLLPEFTALENVCIPAYIARESKTKAEKRAKELLDFLRLADRMEHKPSQLSGGEQQRVAVARALINNPAIILADEPSGNLDSHNRDELHKLFFRLRDEMKQTIVIVTHDEGLAEMSDRKLEMHDGLITAGGAPR
ncbi:MAG: ABC transporter ATP-binding protein [Prevotellaceae bacterium]|jgi:lipoprotein-releasing system ATP-binding protein|nr:ABC transporter ATP-binding protein [Prevotellaceae bacterium]